ncbi:MAG TPA: hydrogenase iron-sulfur subunit [Desulfotomaculum sp.]|nr:hydrogenase iron-sulfur subunit [Desulfotomaculum sp.]
MAEDREPRIVGFLCNWCSYAAADLAGMSRFHYPPHLCAIRVPCTGRMNPLFVMSALRRGADAVLIAGCHPGDCHYVSGNLTARRRFSVFRSLLEFAGVEEGRLNLTWISAAEGKRFASLSTQLTQRAKELGPYKGMLRKRIGV